VAELVKATEALSALSASLSLRLADKQAAPAAVGADTVARLLA